MVAQAVYIYNHERLRLALKYETLDAVHRALADWILCQPVAGLDSTAIAFYLSMRRRNSQRHSNRAPTAHRSSTPRCSGMLSDVRPSISGRIRPIA